jgi:hypothetical protein
MSMTTEIEVFTQEEKTEAAVRSEAERLINKTLSDKGVSRDRLPQIAIDDAYNTARASVKTQQELDSNPYFALYQKEVAKSRQLEDQLKVVDRSAARQAGATSQPSVTVESARAAVGDLKWFHQTSDADKLRLLGVDPGTITKSELQKLFGRGADYAAQADFQKANPKRYATLRECAKALNVYGG